MTINEFWKSLANDERDIIASRYGMTRASISRMIAKGAITQKLQKIVLEYYPHVEFGMDGKTPAKRHLVIGTVKDDLAIAYELLKEIRASVGCNRRIIAWISPKMELQADVTTGAVAAEFLKDPDGLVGLYARRCSLMDVVVDVRRAYLRRKNHKTYDMVSV